jgi:SCY1-like protein 2
VQQPLIDTGKEYVIVTERILGSLANIKGDFTNLSEKTQKILKFSMAPLEYKNGLCQIGEAISFIHTNAKIVHGNINLNNIYVNEDGDFKLSGFNFSFLPENNNKSDITFFPSKIPGSKN